MKFTFTDRPQIDGTKWVHFVFTKGTHEHHTHRRLSQSVDSFTFGNGLIAEITQMLKDEEITQTVQAIKEGGDALALVQGAVENTSKDVAHAVLKYAMAQDEMSFFLKLQSLITYLTTNYTGAQLATWLGVDTATLSKINQRYQNALSAQTAIAADASLISEI